MSNKEYSWDDIEVNILGKVITGIVGVEIEPKTEKEYLRGRGSNPLSIQSGNKSYEGKLTLLLSELDQMVTVVQAVNPTLDLSDVAFDIIWSFVKGGIVKTDTIKGAEFTGYKKGMEQGDKFMKIELPFMALKVIHS